MKKSICSFQEFPYSQMVQLTMNFRPRYENEKAMDMKSHPVYLGLGSNLGDREQSLKDAYEFLEKLPINSMKASSLYESPPYQKMDQPPYLNQVLMGYTFFDPESLLHHCLSIEQAMGRVRLGHWEPRVIDIDILYYGNQTYQSDHLTIPHYDLQNRGFVLVPLQEIAPDWVDIRHGKTITELLNDWIAFTQEPVPLRLPNKNFI